MKTQTVRLFDVFILGPFMIWAGTQLKNDIARTAMIAAGAGTIVYNWQNYRKGGYVPHLHTADCPTGYVTGVQCNE
jgi:hypothetical protein